MKYHLSNKNLKITIDSKGAELCSIQFNNLEYLWQAKADVWPRYAPVLFPIVGKLKDNTYKFNGQTYSLSQHGFARDLEFECASSTNEQIELVLRSDVTTKETYPFDFELTLSYLVKENEISCSYKIKNMNAHSDLYFSIGAHPGFKIPLLESETWNDYQLHFEKGKNYHITKLKDGLLSDVKVSLVLNGSTLELADHLFENDALVFENSQINEVAILSKQTQKGVMVSSDNWPFFGIWSKKGCNEFVCLEPWYGIADDHNSAKELTIKKGIIKLTPLQNFECSYSINLF